MKQVPGHTGVTYDSHDDVIKWKHFPRHWLFVRGIHRSPVNFPHKGQWRGGLMLSLICAWTNGWVKRRQWFEKPSYRLWLHRNVKKCQLNQGCDCQELRLLISPLSILISILLLLSCMCQITFIFDRCNHRSAALTPVKCEHDIQQANHVAMNEINIENYGRKNGLLTQPQSCNVICIITNGTDQCSCLTSRRRLQKPVSVMIFIIRVFRYNFDWFYA